MALGCFHPSVIITDQTQAPSSQHGAGLGGDSGPAQFGRLESWDHDWHGLCPCQVHTHDATSSVRLATYDSPWQLLFSSSWGRDARLLWVDLLDLSPRAGKWSVRVLLSVLILRGHKIVRAIGTHINKTLCVRRRKGKLCRYSKKNYSIIWVSSDSFAGSSSFSSKCCKCERNSQTCSSIHHCGVWPQPDPGNSLRNLNVNKDSVSAAGQDCGIDAPHQLNRKQQLWGHNFAGLFQATTHNLKRWICLHGLCSVTFFPPLFSGSSFEVGRQLVLMLKQFRPVLWFRRWKLFITGRLFGAIELCEFLIMQKIIKG